MSLLPPGTLLQLMYLDERLKLLPPGRFIEIGPGAGEITNRLLRAGWAGMSCDLSETTIERLRKRFPNAISNGVLDARVANFLDLPVPTQPEQKVDLVISCMVMEHLDENAELAFMQHAAKLLSPDGLMIALVPSSSAHWGIEDDIAGHFRRYERHSVKELLEKSGWSQEHISGLTYPVSNLLLPVSNFLVRRAEKQKLNLSKLEQTKQSGHRNVRFKTHFPSVLKVVLNELTMLPFHIMQKMFSSSKNALVLYFEARPGSR